MRRYRRAGGARRVIVATNIAETSLTVPGVSVVIDAGLHKVARYDADRGVDSLTTERITLDSADQRAGRAARLGPGTVRRLWDARDRLAAASRGGDPSRRSVRAVAVDPRVGGIAGHVRVVRQTGRWPPRFRHRRSGNGSVPSSTVRSRHSAARCSACPCIHGLARIVIAARGSFEGCAACAWLSEPARFDGPRAATSCDLLPIIDQWSRMPQHLRRIADQLQRTSQPIVGSAYRDRIDETELRRALLAGYPDRVAKRRPQKPRRIKRRRSRSPPVTAP